jgi:hypothetical protein
MHYLDEIWELERIEDTLIIGESSTISSCRRVPARMLQEIALLSLSKEIWLPSTKNNLLWSLFCTIHRCTEQSLAPRSSGLLGEFIRIRIMITKTIIWT